jgi:hypothetical protein
MLHTARMPDNGTAFGPGVYIARHLRSTLVDADELLDQALTAGAARNDGSGVARLDEWMRGHPHGDFLHGAIFDANMETVERLLRSCRDLTTGLALALDTNGELRTSLFVLQRALGEAVMRLCYIMDADIPPARSLARMAAYQVEGIEGNLAAADAFGSYAVEEGARIRATISELQRRLTEGGFELTPDTRRPPLTAGVTLDGQRENVKFNATDAFKKYVPGSSWQWELGSGVTHSRGWMLSSIVPTLETEAPGTAIELVVGVGLVVFDLADAVARVAAAHTGVYVDWFLKKVHSRRLGANSWTNGGRSLSVGHVEYASRPPEFKAAEGHLGASFRRPAKPPSTP